MILGGDSRFFWSENIPDFAQLPSAWDSSLNTGIGKPALSSLWIESFFNFTAFLSSLGIPWDFVTLFLWVLPAILLSFVSAYILFRTLFPERSKYTLVAGFFYLGNTYFLMILTGGQLGVSLAYSIAPLVLTMFIKTIDKTQLRQSLIAGLVFAAQVLFDPRVAAITFGTVVLLWFFQTWSFALIKKQFMDVFVAPLFLTFLLHSYWILPLVFTGSSTVLPEGYASVSGFEFFSFADFSHALSLLHPNWPENIFGKAYFLQPEFLVLPILAYVSLLFLNGKSNRIILFFASLGLLGVFLSKGANPPFGEINVWLFQNFPGMSVFRDPTKFYILIALSYSILIPYSISNFSSWINSKFKIQNSKLQVKIQNVSIIASILFLLFLVNPILGQIKSHHVPQEYVQLKDFLVNEKEFSRTLWIPQWQRFGYFSNTHPAIGRFEILQSASASGQIKELEGEGMKELLQQLAVKYLIVPYDSEGEIFLEDRKYDEIAYQKTVRDLQELEWVKEVYGFQKVAVFELQGTKDRFWIDGEGFITSWHMRSPAQYEVSFNAEAGSQLVFSEAFDSLWKIKNQTNSFGSHKFNGFFNSFSITHSGDYTVEVYYEPQKWVVRGLFISLATLLSIPLFFIHKQKS